MVASQRERVRLSEWGGESGEGTETPERSCEGEEGASERGLVRGWGLQREMGLQ